MNKNHGCCRRPNFAMAGWLITVVSAVAMGLVVCLHLPTLPKYWLLDLGVPWFFFASGWWYGKKVEEAGGEGYGAQVQKRMRTLLVPYFLCNLIWFPILFAFNWIGWRYCGANRVVDGTWPCIVRCLGLSPFAWPALVPTWYLRALFVVVLVVGAVHRLLKATACSAVRLLSPPLFFWLVYLTRGAWMPSGELWHGFFSFGLSLAGCAYFSTGLAVSGWWAMKGGDAANPPHQPSPPDFVSIIRRELMPVYLLHTVVILPLGWIAKAFRLFPYMATLPGDIVMWFVGIGGAIFLGELLRCHFPRFANFLFGGR